MSKKVIDVIADLLLVVGGIAWGLIGIFDFWVIDYVFGPVWLDGVIHVFMGIAAVYRVLYWKRARSWKCSFAPEKEPAPRKRKKAARKRR